MNDEIRIMGRRGFAVIPLLIIVAALTAVIGLGLIVFNPGQKAPPLNGSENTVACTQDAKLCPDGSYVGRVAPNCEFAACPEPVGNQNVSTAANNATVSVNTNVSIPVANTNGSGSNQNKNVNQNANLNANTNTNTNVNSNINASPKTVSVAAAVANATTYDDQPLCISGNYQSSFEYLALRGSSKVDSGGNPVYDLQIWTTIEPSAGQLTCTSTPEGEKTCTGEVTLCGTFRYAAPGEPGLGHVRAYRYALE
ncbi:MAG: hypothetical protein HY420_00075 [Candidatus Kerfeldbacteria bacterium]|nr:hypothetical protein [Candidatus Kerfeldbacteria bacterium]